MARWDFDAAVIGAGPGGLVASLYIRRFQRSVLLVNGGKPRAAWIPRTHNLIGYEKGISGPDLLRRLQSQVRTIGVERWQGDTRVEKSAGGFSVIDHEDKVVARVRKVILATGIQDTQPTIDNLGSLRESGLMRYCPICDAYEYRGEEITVLAAGEHGAKAALFLAPFAKRVTMIISPEENIPTRLIDECRRKRVRVLRGRVLGIERSVRPLGVWVTIENQAPFWSRVGYVALGFVVNDLAFRYMRKLDRAPSGQLRTDEHQRVGPSGLFAVGDCVERLAQISVAAGQAAVAATALHNELREEE